jgi:Bax protein
VGAKKIYFGNLEVERPNVQALMAVSLVVMIGIIITLHGYKNPNPVRPVKNHLSEPAFFKVATGEDMIELLKENDLWELDDLGSVAPLLIASYPDNLDSFDTEIKKRVFFHGLLPVALTALEEVRVEKKTLSSILAKFSEGYQQLIFSDDWAVWGRVLTTEEINFIFGLTRKYQTKHAHELVGRVDLIPLSMIMAQAAIESSWATSRFAREGNNLFGIWTWGERGMVPESREEGEKHKVAAYDSILDSVRAYILILNRLPAYSKLRLIRRHTMNPLKLADGLLYYSQRRDSYVWEIKDLIKHNELRQYEKCFLTDKPIEYEEYKVVKLIL